LVPELPRFWTPVLLGSENWNFKNHCNWKPRQFASPTSQGRSGTCSVYSSESMSMGLSSTAASEFPLPTWITFSKWS
jgi:hypothetical protein